MVSACREAVKSGKNAYLCARYYELIAYSNH